MVFSGYSTPLGHDIFGMDKQPSDVDLKTYPVISYAAGPGQYSYVRNQHPKDTVQPSTVPKSWGQHSGEDVALFAVGALSTLLFSGTVDQTYIPHAISYALCISIHADRCKVDTDFGQLEGLPQVSHNFLTSASVVEVTDRLNFSDFSSISESFVDQSTNTDSGSCKFLGNSLLIFVINFILCYINS